MDAPLRRLDSPARRRRFSPAPGLGLARARVRGGLYGPSSGPGRSLAGGAPNLQLLQLVPPSAPGGARAGRGAPALPCASRATRAVCGAGRPASSGRGDRLHRQLDDPSDMRPGTANLGDGDARIGKGEHGVAGEARFAAHRVRQALGNPGGQLVAAQRLGSEALAAQPILLLLVAGRLAISEAEARRGGSASLEPGGVAAPLRGPPYPL